MKNNYVSIKKKLIISYVVIIIVLTCLSSYILYTNFILTKTYNSFIESILMLNEIQSYLGDSKKNLDKLLLTRSTNYIDLIYSSIDEARETIKKFQKTNITEDNYMITKDLLNLLNSYEKYSEETFRIALSSADERYIENYNKSNKVYSYIFKALEEINYNISRSGFENYSIMIQHNSKLFNILIFMLGIVLFGSLAFAYIFSINMVRSINKLTEAAKKVSKGNFDIGIIEIDSNDELSILAKAFNKMIDNIRFLLDEIKKKAELEKEAQFLALQSQINPHFLFNTLNVIAKMSLLEGGEKTCDLIESLSDMLRYNLRKIDSSVMIYEELKNIEEYVKIQRTRFLDRIDFYKDVDENVLKYYIPALTIQPLVENAFIHGLEGKEDKGIIELLIKDEDEFIRIEVRDNGKGFDFDKNTEETKGHTTGIGLKNVRERLNIFFKGKSQMYIKNRDEGHGAVVGILIPKVGKQNV
ncbi:hypothetical protein Y919_05705 [Caloranaerobacter azorensis H53214]|uniref:HAMP domain-containing protein n=1 Tax=Caloranaerobacter azorensis H53214 TaxID=1156417 RepID=A0A096BHA2_9FIRM|nr:sensor histidine kinase [Caloranaerobacter azorensis]KGG80530.1 hypothetical protein Y919_05705 [Caloranaerobacter azorensis H53214]